MTQTNRILIIEDDDASYLLAKKVLTEFETVQARSLDEARTQLTRNLPTLILLDIHLGQESGLEFCAELKNHSTWTEVPVILLTTSMEIRHKVVAFGLGAEDFIVKPFHFEEFRARVKARIQKQVERPFSILRAGELELDTATQTVIHHGERLDLSPREFKLFLTMLRAPGRIFSREELIHLLRGSDPDVSDRSIDSQMSKLRKKLKSTRVKLRSVYGEGYRLELNSRE